MDPRLVAVAWTDEEDALIARLRAELGNRWKLIAEQLPGRFDRSVIQQDDCACGMLPGMRTAGLRQRSRTGTTQTCGA